jgi:serine phosphatase RsbU (regulator of sigma subunit)
LAAVEDIGELTVDTEVALEDGDILVLYTDGVTEAMNEAREQFGLRRLIATVERHADQPPEQLCEVVLRTCMGWSSAQVDDVSLVIAKYHAN